MQYVQANGVKVPELGFGTFELSPDDAYRMVRHALATGYRHIDTAQMYHNEAAVGAAISASGIDRKEIFLTTKVAPENVAGGDLQASVEASLARLDTDYVDLLLQHWPSPEVPVAESVGALGDTQHRGLTRAIGVSNFTTGLIAEAVAASEVALATDQVEYHPYLNQDAVKQRVLSEDMALTAYCPLAQGRVFDDDTLAEIGRAHAKNAGQVALRWLHQQDGVIPIPRSRSEAHAESNFEIFDFKLAADEMEQIHALARTDGRLISPSSLAPEWD